MPENERSAPSGAGRLRHPRSMPENERSAPSPIAEYFRTAIVVDDRVEFHPDGIRDHEWAAEPGETERTSSSSESPLTALAYASPREGMLAPEEESDEKPIPISSLVRKFFEAGLACSVIKARGRDDPVYSMDLPDHAGEHLWILDWMVDGDWSATVNLIEKLTESASDAFLVIVVFTGHDLDQVSAELIDKFGFSEIDEHPYAFRKSNTIALAIGKPDSRDSRLPDGQAQRFLESYQDLPGAIFSDLEKMLEGIVPNLVFAAVNQVRSQTPRILSSLGIDLDRPFLLHRMLLPEPDDASAQLLELLAAEFEDILHESGIAESFGSVNEIERHIGEAEGLRQSCATVSQFLSSSPHWDKSDDAGIPVVHGLASLGMLNWISGGKRGKRLQKLSASFDVDPLLIMRFSALICARRIGKTPPTLEMGIVLRERHRPEEGSTSQQQDAAPNEQASNGAAGGGLLLCIQPRCDSVRLREYTPFPFLPLRELQPNPADADAIAAETGSFTVFEEDRYIQVAATRKFRDVTFKRFEPSQDGVVSAAESQGSWIFQDIQGSEYGVLCKLRGSFVRRELQSLLSDIGRPAIDDMEWLRRYGRTKR